jgi:hypothetical protein
VKNKGADGYEYNGRLLGLHEESVITYLKSNPEVTVQLARDIEDNDKMTDSIQKEESEIIEKDEKKKPGPKSGTGKGKNDDM